MRGGKPLHVSFLYFFFLFSLSFLGTSGVGSPSGWAGDWVQRQEEAEGAGHLGGTQFPRLLEEDSGFMSPKSPTQSLLQMPPATPHNHGHGSQNQTVQRRSQGWGGVSAWETWGEVLEGKERFSQCTGWGYTSRQKGKVQEV